MSWWVQYRTVLKRTRISANFNHQWSLSMKIKLYKNIPAVMKYRISVTRFQKKLWVHCHIFLALSPMKFLFQIARRRRTRRIFTTNVFNVERNLLTSATLVSRSNDETHSVTSEDPNVHLAKGQVRASSKYIWPVPLRHPSQWQYQIRIKNTVSLILMPMLYCHLGRYQYEFYWCQFLVLYEYILKIRISYFIE